MATNGLGGSMCLKKQCSTSCIVGISFRVAYETFTYVRDKRSAIELAYRTSRGHEHNAEAPELRREAKLPCTVLTSLPSLSLAMGPLTLRHAVFITFPQPPVKHKRSQLNVARICWSG